MRRGTWDVVLDTLIMIIMNQIVLLSDFREFFFQRCDILMKIVRLMYSKNDATWDVVLDTLIMIIINQIAVLLSDYSRDKY